MPAAIFVKRCASSSSERLSSVRKATNSSDSPVEGSGASPAASYSTPLWTSIVASPPSSRMRFGPSSSGQSSACSVHHQYSVERLALPGEDRHALGSSGVPSGPTTAAAAAWSCVEKMLQLHQRTSAPSAVSVSISTAVWIVMCSEPVMRAPLSGCASAYSARVCIRPGISCSARIDLLAAVVGEREVGDLEVLLRVDGGGGWVHACVSSVRRALCAGVRPGEGQQLRVLVLLPAQPLGRRDVLGAARLRLRTTRRRRPRAPRRGAAAARSRSRRGRCRSASTSSRSVRRRCSSPGP